MKIVIIIINGILYSIVFLCNGVSVESLLYCLMTTVLLALSIIDYKTCVIPLEFNIYIMILGFIRCMYDYVNLYSHIIGFFIVSGWIFLIMIITKGKGMGGGDMKLMAGSGLFLGWKLIIFSFFIGCLLGFIIQFLKTIIYRKRCVFAMGPYLSVGIYLSMLYGSTMLDFYQKL